MHSNNDKTIAIALYDSIMSPHANRILHTFKISREKILESNINLEYFIIQKGNPQAVGGA